MVYIDFHTHSIKSIPNLVQVISVEVDNSSKLDFIKYCTAGVHPWNASISRLDEDITSIMKLLSNPKFIGVGEIGLDKLKGPNLQEQIKVLTKQLDIAKSIGKPVVIHCVKAWDELIRIKKHYSNINWAIHGFNGSPQLAKQLIDKGFYISVGESFIRKGEKSGKALLEITTNRLFLETDTSTISIEEFYEEVADNLGLSVDEMKLQLIKNFITFFGFEPKWE
jgi:TatD DNase family protein